MIQVIPAFKNFLTHLSILASVLIGAIYMTPQNESLPNSFFSFLIRTYALEDPGASQLTKPNQIAGVAAYETSGTRTAFAMWVGYPNPAPPLGNIIHAGYYFELESNFVNILAITSPAVVQVNLYAGGGISAIIAMDKISTGQYGNVFHVTKEFHIY